MAVKHLATSFVEKYMRVYLFIAFFFFIISCDKSENDLDSNLDLVFELRYDGELLASPTSLHNLNDSVQIRFSKVSFYLSDFKLVGKDGVLDLLDIIHVSFLQNIDGDAISETKQILSFDIPSGDYDSFSFGLGLTPEQNATEPSDYSAGSALSYTSEYWPAWKSYIFEKLEGAYKLRDEPEESVALHVGADETYRVLEWKDGITLSGNRGMQIVVPIDLKQILDGYPLPEAPVLHMLAQLPYMERIADGFSKSMNN